MATVVTRDNGPIGIENSLGDFVDQLIPEATTLQNTFAEIFQYASDSAEEISRSDSQLVAHTYYPEGTLTYLGSGFISGPPVTIKSFVFSGTDPYTALGLTFSGSGRVVIDESNQWPYITVNGAFTKISVAEADLSIAYEGNFSLDDSVATYSSITYSLQADDGSVSSLALKGAMADTVDGIGGTVTSADFAWDADGAGPLQAQHLLTVTGIAMPFEHIVSATDVAALVAEIMSGDDSVSGSSGDDVLDGYGGNDILNGGAGIDAMIGGTGDDIYVVDSVGETVTENADEGTDTVKVAIATAGLDYTLAANVENGTLTNRVAFNLNGNELANVLTGNSAANRLDGGAGADALNGGGGNDSYVVDNAGDVVIDSAGIDAVESSVGYTLAAGLENLMLTGGDHIDGAGNALANTLRGNDGANMLAGGLGKDIYYVGAGDTVVEEVAGGIDLVFAAADFTLDVNVENLTLVGSDDINGTGNALINTILGNSGDNRLDGGAADNLVDKLKGGAGDDTYVVDLTVSNRLQDALTESADQGTDNVLVRGGTALATYSTLTLKSTLENLDVSGTSADILLNLSGNGAANVLIGNAGANTLNGKAGVDTLIGGTGDDTYVVDSVGETVTEQLDEGTDTLKIAIATAGLDYTLGDNVENGTLSNRVVFNLNGNELVNVLTGNSAANRLDGGVGADTLNGGSGNDTYVVDNVGDVVTDRAGVDTVESSVSYTLPTGLENLTMTGSDNLDGVGNALANTLRGNDGANALAGGAGKDVLWGGLGDDTFVFDSVLSASTNFDKIMDFSAGDELQLDLAIFGALSGGVTDNNLLAGAGVTTAISADQHLIYNTSSGALYYDADGGGGAAAVLFAYVDQNGSDTTHPGLTAADFTVI